jgi:hypothetical protein
MGDKMDKRILSLKEVRWKAAYTARKMASVVRFFKNSDKEAKIVAEENMAEKAYIELECRDDLFAACVEFCPFFKCFDIDWIPKKEEE